MAAHTVIARRWKKRLAPSIEEAERDIFNKYIKK